METERGGVQGVRETVVMCHAFDPAHAFQVSRLGNTKHRWLKPCMEPAIIGGLCERHAREMDKC